jgi:TP901 family phage tail tape measure protein
MFKQANNLKKEMANLDKQIGKTTDNVAPLIDQQKDLAAQLEKVNAQIDRQKALNAFHADTNRIDQRGAALRSAGTDNVLGGAAMAAPLILAGKAAMDFSSGMVDIAQKANLTQDQTNAMAQGILRAAQAAHQMPEAMRQGVDALSGFGIDPREAMQMIGPIGRLGTAMKVDIADGAAAASANLQNLKVGLGDTGKALDIMAAGGNVGAFEVRDMARYFPSLTAQAQALGQSGLGAVADLTAALEIARRGAGTSEEAATNIANLLAKINSPTVTRAFAKNFGVDLPAALKAAYAQGKTPMEALAAITQKATGGDLSKLGLVVEDMQAQSALRTLILNMDDYRKIRADLGKSGGTVQAAFAQREALDASVAWQSFTGTMSALAITLGATLLPSVTQFFGWVNTGVSAIARWAQANPELAGQIMTLASAFIAGRMALGALQFGFGSALSGLAALRNGFVMARTGIAFIQPAFSMISAMGGRLVPVILQIASALGTALPLAARALVGDLLKVGSAVIGIGRAAMAFVVQSLPAAGRRLGSHCLPDLCELGQGARLHQCRDRKDQRHFHRPAGLAEVGRQDDDHGPDCRAVSGPGGRACVLAGPEGNLCLPQAEPDPQPLAGLHGNGWLSDPGPVARHHRRHRTALARHGPDGPPRGGRRGALAVRSLAHPFGHARLCPHGATRRQCSRSPCRADHHPHPPAARRGRRSAGPPRHAVDRPRKARLGPLCRRF